MRERFLTKFKWNLDSTLWNMVWLQNTVWSQEPRSLSQWSLWVSFNLGYSMILYQIHIQKIYWGKRIRLNLVSCAACAATLVLLLECVLQLLCSSQCRWKEAEWLGKTSCMASPDLGFSWDVAWVHNQDWVHNQLTLLLCFTVRMFPSTTASDIKQHIVVDTPLNLSP